MLSRLNFLLILLFVASCGFSPMYGSGSSSANGQLEHVDIAIIPNESGVYLRNILIDHFYQNGYPKTPSHILTATPLIENISDLDITIESDATRKQIRLSTIMSLTDIKTGQTVLSRNLSALTSYNVLDSQFTTRVAEQDAREAALVDLARQIESQTMLYFKR